MLRVIVAGATGLIGLSLVKKLSAKNLPTLAISRFENKKELFNLPNVEFATYETLKLDPQDDYLIINLAGENLGAKFIGKKRLQELYDSRVAVIDKLFKLCPKPLAYFQGSGFNVQDNGNKSPFTSFAQALEEYGSKTFLQSKTLMLRFGLVLDDSALTVKIFKKLPPLYFLDGNNHLPIVSLESTSEKILFFIENLQNLNSYVYLYDKTLTLNELFTLMHQTKFKLPLIRLFLRFFDLRGRLLDFDFKEEP